MAEALSGARRDDPRQFQSHQYEKHQQMCEAIRARDSSGALRTARAHLYETFEEFLTEDQRTRLRPLVEAAGEI